MTKIIYILLVVSFLASCKERNTGQKSTSAPETAVTPQGAVIIAHDVATEIIIRPDPEGDPWDIEKVAGYHGEEFVNDIFRQIYDGTLKVFDYHSGEPMSASDVRKIEKEFNDDRSRIGKLSFTEDWYYFPATNRLEKRARSVTFGYELYNNSGKVYAYRAAFRADLDTTDNN
jgi:hypothetical protein